MIKRAYAIHSHSSPIDGEGFQEDVTHLATNVRVTRRRMGGLWDMSFTIPAVLPSGKRVGRAIFQDWFNNKLFTVIKQVMGAPIFEGVVWMLDLTLDGITIRRDYSEMYNAVRVDYVEEDGTTGSTSWYTDDSSINSYGRRELISYMRNSTATIAQNEAQTILTETAEAWPQTINVDPNMRDRLEVMVAGKIFTANNKFVSASTLDGGTGNLSTLVENIITNDMQFLSKGSVESNTIQYKRSLDVPIRAWDYIVELTRIGNGSSPFAVTGRLGGVVDYLSVDNEPLVFWEGRRTGLTMKGVPLSLYDAWTMGANVFRDNTRNANKAVPGSFLQQGNDSWIFEVEMADGLEQPVLKPDSYEDDEVLRAMRLYQMWQEYEYKEGSDVTFISGSRDYPARERQI